MARLILTLLGGFEARPEGGPPITLPVKKAHALLAYLALESGQAHPRAKLAALLWGELREEQARHSLRQAILALRRALATAGPVTLHIDGDALALDPAAVEVDATAFARLVAEGTPEALAQAAALYRGDLLEGLALQEPPFEEWLMAERERLRELALEALAKLLAHQRSVGSTQAAVQTARRLLVLDPLQEAVYRTLMRLYVEQGRRGMALQQYQLCVGVLQRELGVEPEAETRQLYQEILRQRASRPATADASRQAPQGPPAHGPFVRSRPALELDAPLIGRELEVARLREGLEAAGRGRGRVVAIIGEAGIGKTRLVAELAADAVQKGARVLFGRSYETEQILPFGPWVDAFRTGQVTQEVETLQGLGPIWRAELARLFPELGAPTTPAPDHRQLFEGVAQLVGSLAARQPLLLIVEDLHWADEMSLRLLAFLGRRVQEWSVLVTVTAREEELADAPVLRRALEDLTGERCLVPLTLPPLSQEDTLALVRVLTPAGTEADAMVRLEEQVWVVSEGNPFMVVESMRVLSDRGMAQTAQALRLPERVRELVSRRLERLSERSQSLGAVAAVIAREFDFTLLQQAAGLTEGDAAAGVEELVRRRVLHGVGERFDFTHDRIREVAYARLLPPRRKLLHRQVAKALEALYAANLEPHHLALSVHYRDGEVWDKALTHLRRAGVNALTRSANREAVSCFEQAVAALGHLPERRDTIEQAIDLRFDLQGPFIPLGELGRLLDYLREAEPLAEALGDQHRLGRVSAHMAHCFWWMGNPDRAVESGERASAIASALGDFPLQVLANFRLGQAYFSLGEVRRATDVLRRTVNALEGELARERFGLTGLAAVLYRSALVWCLPILGEFAAGKAAAEEGLLVAEAAEHPYSQAVAYWTVALSPLAQGNLPNAILWLERSLDLCQKRNLTFLWPWVAGDLGRAYALSGRVAEGLALLQRALEQEASMKLMMVHPRDVTSLGEAHLLAGQGGEALESVQHALHLAQAHKQRGTEAHALRVFAEICSSQDPPDMEKAEASYHEALTLAEEMEMRPLVARCHLGLGKLYRRAGDHLKAQEHLTAATTMFREMDMQFWLERAEAELKALA